MSQDAFNATAQAGIYRIRHTRGDNKTLVEELLESSCFYFGTIIQEVENVRCYDFDAEGEMSYEEGKEIIQGQERGSAAMIDRCAQRYLGCVKLEIYERDAVSITETLEVCPSLSSQYK